MTKENLERKQAKYPDPDFLLSLRCPKCDSDSSKIVIEKNLPNIIFLRCLRCQCLFYITTGVLSEEEVEFLKRSRIYRIPFKKLDMNKEKKVDYVE